MKLKAAAAMLVLLSCAAARAQDKPVELLDGPLGISFVPPPGAERLGEEEAARLAGAGGRLNVAFSKPGSATLLTVNTFDAAAGGLSGGASEDDRQALKRKLESDIPARFAAVEWMSRGVININGPRWVRLLYKGTTKKGGQVVADTYAITWFGRVVLFTYLCPPDAYERQRAAFEKSAASIRLTIFATPVEGAKPARRPGRRKP